MKQALPQARMYFFLVLTLVLCLFSLLTYSRNEVFRDEVTLYNDVIKKSPLKSRGYICLGILYHKAGMYSKAIAYYNLAEEKDPVKNPQVYNNRGVLLAMMGRRDEAILDLTKAIELSPDMAGYYVNRAQVYSEAGLIDKTIVDLSQALTLNPQDRETLYKRGNVYMRMGDIAKAQTDYSKSCVMGFDDACANLR